ncbi:EAL domain-containing protein [Marinobacter salsuginis]|uniref:sensor domain-containing phosphodiesterase n=1 Tax=Marinobacter salsuginis TaxID=418719 RepID=UPI001C9609E9|nr:EAL domain-containing protein [Marinobacter salsuginis]MBY6072014.1 EAL domain-containing protein [Marinobacter salsuginis]
MNSKMPTIDQQLLEDVIASNSSQYSSAMQTMLEAVRNHLGMDVAFVSRIEDGKRSFDFVDSRIPPPIQPGDSNDAEDSYCQRVIDGRLPELIKDAKEIEETRALPGTESLPIGAHLSVPITLDNGDVYGTFCCFSRQPDPSLTARDLDVLRTFADIAGKHISHKETARRQREASRAEVQDILAQKRLTMVFQPIQDICVREVVSFESLARFETPVRKPPNIWFDQARSAGMAAELELHAVSQALKQACCLPEQCYLSVNLSPETILEADLKTALSVPEPDKLVIEVTEHSTIDDYEKVAAALEPLRAQGVKLAVDDAGAGYASFRHILALAPDIIKLDMSITRDIDSDFRKQALAKSMIAFAEATSCEIIAEGVETGAELRELRALGIQKAQGYLIEKPMPASDLRAKGYN